MSNVARNISISRLSSGVISRFSLAYQSFSPFHFAVDSWITMLFSVQGVLVLFDTLYRVILTCRHVRSFWSKAVVSISPVNLLSKQPEFDSPIVNKLYLLLQFLPFIWFQFLLVIVLIIFVIWLITGAF